MSDPYEIVLKRVRLAFPDIYVAKPFKGNDDDPKFAATFLLDMDSQDDQIKKLKKLILKVSSDKWGDDVPKKTQFNNEKCTAGLGNDLDKVFDGYADHVYLKASNANRPKLRDRDNEPVTKDDPVIYGGCYVHAIIHIWAQDNGYGKRINGSLQAIKFVAHGDGFGGGTIAEDVTDAFDEIEDEEEDDDFLD